jgi:hypothetical protein
VSFSKILLIGSLTLMALSMLVVFDASAQAPPDDVPLAPLGGVYPVKAQAADDSDMAEICCVRADAAPVDELGCVPAGASEIVTIEVTVVATEDNDAEIRCYAVDTTGLVSDYSPNAGIVDFTRPGIVVILP